MLAKHSWFVTEPYAVSSHFSPKVGGTAWFRARWCSHLPRARQQHGMATIATFIAGPNDDDDDDHCCCRKETAARAKRLLVQMSCKSAVTSHGLRDALVRAPMKFSGQGHTGIR